MPADGLKLAVDEENYSRLPIIPIWGSDAHQSTLVGLRESVDAYDLIKSGFANTVQDCAEIYWIVENAGGMKDKDLQQLRDRLLLTQPTRRTARKSRRIRKRSRMRREKPCSSS